MTSFDFSFASVIGSEHVRLSLNNQDALVVTRGDWYSMGIVSDGCGSCQRSEVGSALTVRLAAKFIPDALRGVPVELVADKFKVVRRNIVSALGRIVNEVSNELMDSVSGFDVHGGYGGFLTEEGSISSCFLATIVGFYACDEYVVVFSIGDGFYAVNGVLAAVDADRPSDNAPDYPAYHLLPRVMESLPDGSAEFSIRTFSTKDVDTVMVGTDGLRFLLNSEESKVPGKASKVGKISQLWEDKMFLNHDMMRRTLALLNKDVHIPDWQGQSMIVCPSILKDDIAVVSARRRK